MDKEKIALIDELLRRSPSEVIAGLLSLSTEDLLKLHSVLSKRLSELNSQNPKPNIGVTHEKS